MTAGTSFLQRLREAGETGIVWAVKLVLVLVILNWVFVQLMTLKTQAAHGEEVYQALVKQHAQPAKPPTPPVKPKPPGGTP